MYIVELHIDGRFGVADRYLATTIQEAKLMKQKLTNKSWDYSVKIIPFEDFFKFPKEIENIKI